MESMLQNSLESEYHHLIFSKCFKDLLLQEIYPLIKNIILIITPIPPEQWEQHTKKIYYEFLMCCMQVKKCVYNMFPIVMLENTLKLLLKDTRQFIMERLLWCANTLYSVENQLELLKSGNKSLKSDPTLLSSPVCFVNWIDNTFEILSKLSKIANEKENKTHLEEWKDNIVKCSAQLHVAIDELLLSAITLSHYCMDSDVQAIKARCQAVLRETKMLMAEIIDGNINVAYTIDVNSLRLPIRPSHLNVLIDVLKDVLYALETNMNNALLSVLIDCFTNMDQHLEFMRSHFNNGECACTKGTDAGCQIVKQFDLCTERLLHIGHFAMSCSSDKNRIVRLHSGLVSLEALDPHLVPALMMSPEGHHAQLLTRFWYQELRDIKDNVFLIVDPAAFTEKCKQIMHLKLLDLIKSKMLDDALVSTVINTASLIQDFFDVYNKNEPDALNLWGELTPLIADLSKTIKESKTVQKMLSEAENCDPNTSDKNCKITLERLIKRLKLVFTIVSRINTVLHPRENEDQLMFEICENSEGPKNTIREYNTFTRSGRNADTFVLSHKKSVLINRSTFIRTRDASREIDLSTLKHFNMNTCNTFSFSEKLDEICKVETSQRITAPRSFISMGTVNGHVKKTRASLRKAVLDKQYRSAPKQFETTENTATDSSSPDDLTSLQVTDILDQLAEITNTLSVLKEPSNTCKIPVNQDNLAKQSQSANGCTTISKYVWNIPINGSSVEMALDVSSVSQPSDVTTSDRLRDLDLVESRLRSLKTLQETII